MNVIARILLMVNGAFLLALAFSLFSLLEQGRSDVIREQQAMKPVVEALIQSGKPQEILALVGTSLRHVRLLEDASRTELAVPNWFEQLFDHPGRGYQLAFTGSNGEKRILVPDDSDEIQEVWESASGVFWLFLLAALLSNLAIYLGLKTGLKPVADVLKALEQIQRGELQTRLGNYALPEARQVAEHFNHMAQALQQVREENRQLTRTIMNVQEHERAALARELHDDLGQQVTAMRAQAFLVPYQAGQSSDLQQTSSRLLQGCDAIQSGFRRIIHNLYPVLLEQLGLQAAIQELLDGLEDAGPVQCQLLGDWPHLDNEAASQLYRLIQEAVHNAIRHGQASELIVSAERLADAGWQFCVVDNGIGSEAIAAGFGIRSMQERAALLGGDCQIHSQPGKGTRVEVRLAS
ncbi:HAMP domain-containing sensor histidine kinase [Oceanobacter mangrovi]|uniref:HAMP domain-containing sensor histidine kinase n=1 Tax=Oceanobacter mangrovi TaxID=2862510 RepID=UPI001C8E706B|nr:histidine kinase [Oceanobacter mangrovi]